MDRGFAGRPFGHDGATRGEKVRGHERPKNYVRVRSVQALITDARPIGWHVLDVPIAEIEPRLTSLREKLVKIDAKVVRHDRYVVLQMAEVAAPRQLFGEILRLIAGLRPRPTPA